MWLPPFAPLRLEPRPSRRLARLLILFHGAAAGAIWSLPLPMAPLLLLDLVILLSYLRSRRAVLAPAFSWGGDGRWRDLQGGEWALHGESFVTPWLVILQLRNASGRRLTLVLPDDTLAADLHRRLRVRLRFSRSPAELELELADGGGV